MNKVYTIGRDTSCDIVIPDSTDVVSRVHASIKVKGNGKYILIDQSRNGTYVNGIKMSTEEEIPVTRKDVISFAHVSDLDWNMIPKGNATKIIWMFICIGIVAIACICYWSFKSSKDQKPTVIEELDLPAVINEEPIVKDTTAKETIYIKPKPVVKPVRTKEKPKEKPEERAVEEEPEVVNPLL